MIASFCVCNFTPVEIDGSANNLGLEIFRFPHFNSLFAEIKYTCNMAAWFGAHFDDLIAPYVLPV